MIRAGAVGAAAVLATVLAGCAGRPAAPSGPRDALDWRSPWSAVGGPGAGAASPAVGGDGAGVVVSSEPWAFGAAPGRVIRTRHLRVYTTLERGLLLDRAPAFLEAALTHYAGAVTRLPGPDAPLDTYIMAGRAQWFRLAQAVLGERSGALGTVGRGGFAQGGRGYFFDIGPADTLAIAAHEGWHQYTQRVFRQRLPLWAEEGMATYMEGHKWVNDRPVFLPWRNTERFDRLRLAQGGDQSLALPELLRASPEVLLGTGTGERALVYYAQLWALMHFLMEGQGGKHRPAVERMLRDAAQGTLAAAVRASASGRAAGLRADGLADLGPAVFEAYTGESPEALDEAYRSFVQRLVRSNVRGAIVEGVSPFAAADAP
ncbi:MAG: hypothetical protein C0513_04405 [Isosphaera sp.]|nr:hypothetical protein [Isosphaera sp.]